MHRVVALALPKVVAFDLAIAGHVFGHPRPLSGYRFRVCARVPGLVPSTSGFAVEAKWGLEALGWADTVVVPGYSPHGRPPEATLVALRQAAARGARLVSVCTGAFALAAAGLLDGLRATTHWEAATELADSYPLVEVDPDVLYVVSGNIGTSAGVAAGIDLCLSLVRSDYGAAAALGIARSMVVAPHREGGQAQFIPRPVPVAGTGLATTCEWAVAQLYEPLTVADLARHAGWAPRTFARHFRAETGTSPLRWLTSQRLLEARRLLETTDFSVEEVARRCGLGTAANLRLLLRRQTAGTPTGYRRTFRGPGPPGTGPGRDELGGS